jgi:hypothetical protein
VFSRAGEDTSARFSEVGSAVRSACGPSVTSLIVEGEVVAVDPASGTILPFQSLSARHRYVGPALHVLLCPRRSSGLASPRLAPSMTVLRVPCGVPLWREHPMQGLQGLCPGAAMAGWGGSRPTCGGGTGGGW